MSKRKDWKDEVCGFFDSMEIEVESGVDSAWADLAKFATKGMAVSWVQELLEGAIREAYQAGWSAGNVDVKKFASRENRGRAAQAMRDRQLHLVLKKYHCEEE